MRRLYWVLAAAWLAAIACAAPAQLAVPVASDSTQASTATQQVAVPSAQVEPYTPATIDVPPPTADVPAPQPQATQPPDQPPPAATPPPPNEFETYVSEIAGKPLRRFGAELLVPGARNFTAPPTTAIPPDYRINPGDELTLGLTGAVQATGVRLRVGNDGRIFVPKVGAVTVGGVRYGDLHDVIAREVSRQYRDFDLEVTVSRLHGITVYVTGFAARPGSYTVGSLSTLVNAVLAAGGPSSGGSFRSMQLRRDGRLVSDFDLYDLLLRGDKTGDAVLQNGDVIYIAPAGEQVAVIGSVNREGIYELAPGEKLTDAVLYAGGVNTVADSSRLMVFNGMVGGVPGWREVTPDEARTRVAERGDVIRVLSGVGIALPIAQQSVLVTIGGEVARPGRYYFAPGTRLADVIARAGGLTPQAFPYASVFTRESVKHQQQLSYDRAVNDVEMLLTAQPVTSANRAERVQPADLALVQSVVAQMRKRKPDGRVVMDIPVNATSLPGDMVLENNDTIYIPTQPVTVGVFGSVPSPGSFTYHQGERIGEYVKAAGGVQEIGDKSEIFVVRANGTVLAKGRDALRAPALPGDLVYVPIDANRGEFWARLRDITSSIFGGLFGAATIKAAVD
ncbi:MAG TPA: SLBB domain-containing protein [Sphingomonadaceae bacterium]